MNVYKIKVNFTTSKGYPVDKDYIFNSQNEFIVDLETLFVSIVARYCIEKADIEVIDINKIHANYFS